MDMQCESVAPSEPDGREVEPLGSFSTLGCLGGGGSCGSQTQAIILARSLELVRSLLLILRTLRLTFWEVKEISGIGGILSRRVPLGGGIGAIKHI